MTSSPQKGSPTLLLLSIGVFAFCGGAIFGVFTYDSIGLSSGGPVTGQLTDSALVGAGVQNGALLGVPEGNTLAPTVVSKEPLEGGVEVETDDLPDSVSWRWSLAQNNALLVVANGNDPDAQTSTALGSATSGRYSPWLGDARLAIATGGDAKAWDDFVNKSTELALHDPKKRAMIICPKAIQEAGLGNALFAAAGSIALAARFNMLPVIPCRKNKQLGALGFKYMHCVDERAMRFNQIGDGGGHFDMKYQSILETRARSSPPMHSLVRGYFQYYRGFGAARDAVCWGLRPDAAAQQAAIDYLFDNAFGNNTDFMDEHTSIVAAHVRRGDYGGKNKMHGFLSEHYYSSSWKMLQAQVSLESKLAGKSLVVVIFAMSNEIDWVKQHITNKFPGAKKVIVLDPFQRGRGPKADIDMLAMALAHYFILPNSTFSWWASFFADCKRRLGNQWWSAPARWKSRTLRRPLNTLPHRWHVGRDTRFPETYQYMQSRYLFPGLFPLYENEDDIAEKNKKK